MGAEKADIIARLQQEILTLSGYKPAWNKAALDLGTGPLRYAFPGHVFPQGVLHELLASGAEDVAATYGFVSGILSSLMSDSGTVLWISSSRILFPPGLNYFGINPDRIIFIDLLKEKDVLWAMEEALKCEGLNAVVGELKDLDFTTSRRLQLAVEASRVTGFIIRKNTQTAHTTACLTRWRIKSLTSFIDGNMPGVGFPVWNIELLKVRNGKPGSWQLVWNAGRLKPAVQETSIKENLHKKTG